jgi:hypothetical protein
MARSWDILPGETPRIEATWPGLTPMERRSIALSLFTLIFLLFFLSRRLGDSLGEVYHEHSEWGRNFEKF